MWFLTGVLAFLCVGLAYNDDTKDTCMDSLGAVYKGYLPDSALTASSATLNFGPANGRLNSPRSAWIPKNWQPQLPMKDPSTLDFLQIDLQSMKTVTAISTQGLRNKIFVRRFSLMFSLDGEAFDPFYHVGIKKVFDGNTDAKSVKKSILPCHVVARYIRIVPEWYVNGGGFGLRADVHGCYAVPKKNPSISTFGVGSKTPNSIDVLWKNVRNLGVFTLSYHPLQDKKSLRWFYVRRRNESLPVIYGQRISALSSCTEYKVILRSFSAAACGIPEVYTKTVTTKESRPPMPQNLRASNDVPNRLLVSWSKSPSGYLCADNINKFVIYYKVYADKLNPRGVIEVDSATISYSINNLQSWQEYEISVVAVSRLGTSDEAKNVFKVKGKPPTEPPIITKIISAKPNSVYVEWKDPPLASVNGQIRGYQLYYREKADPPINYSSIGLDTIKKDKSYTLNQLKPWKKYQVYVSLYNLEYDIKSEFKEVLVRGKEPGKAPSNVEASKYLSSIILKWSAVQPEYLPQVFEGYQVYYGEGIIKNGADLKTYGALTKELQKEFTGLAQGTNYSFAVAASSNSVFGPLSDMLYVETFSGPLPSPEITEIKSSSPNTIFVKWKIDPKVLPERFELIYKESQKLDTWKSIKLGADSRSYTLTGLKSWMSYDVQIILSDKTRKSESNPRPVLVVYKQPGKAPENVQVSRVGHVSVSLEWGDIDETYVFGQIKGYVVRYSKDADINSFEYKTTYKRNITIANLTHNTGYYFSVAGFTIARVGNEVGVFSNQINRRTLKIEPPMKPKIIIAENLNPQRILLKWEMMNEPSTDIVIAIFILMENMATGTIKRYTTTVTSLPDTDSSMKSMNINVESYVSYRVKIDLCRGEVCSGLSDPYYITSMEGKPSKVQNIQIAGVSNGLKVSWSPPKNASGVIRKYTISFKNDYGNITGFPLDVDNSTLSYVAENLPPYQNMKVEITAHTTMKGPTASKDFRSPEGKPGPPNEVTGVTINGGKIITVRWKPPSQPNGVILDYMIMWTGKKFYDSTFLEKKNETVDVNNSVLQYRLKNLVPGTQYNVDIYARTSKGYGTRSRIQKTFYTPVKEPIAPPPPSIDHDSVTSSSIIINFKPVRQLNGEVYAYQIIVEEVDNNSVSRKRRDTTSQTVNLPENIEGYKEGSKLYITAQIMFSKIANIHLHKFKIGSKHSEGGYVNQPLKPETNYKLYIRATSKGPQGNLLYGSAVRINLPKTAVAGQISGKVNFPIAVLIGIVFGIIFVIVVVVVVFCYIKRRRRLEKDNMNPIELGLISVQQRDEDDEFDAPKKRPPSLTGDYPIRSDHPPIAISAFPKIVAKLHRNDDTGFYAEYAQLEIGKEFSWDIAHLPENKPKNRYANIVAYDHSRVILTRIEGEPGSDYVNASYIDGYKRPNAYISTQGPLPKTFVDFWRMVWEVRSTAVVMLTNLQEKNKLKCHKYWPDDCTEYGNVLVTMARKEFYADFTIRVFKLEKLPRQDNCANEVREVRQFHFTCWPEHGVPKHSTQMINFRKKVRSYDTPDSGPTIVHCSAGVGRSGAYIAVDTMMERAKGQGDVDVFNYIASIRTRRIAMVQTKEQYIFVHDAVLEAVMTGDTHIKVHELKPAIRKLDQIENDTSQISGFEKQWKTLNHTSAGIEESNFLTGKLPENMEKNRYSTALPFDTNRVLLEMMNNDESTSYINAAYVDSYKQRNSFILTQSPLPHTVDDFWRMLCEHGSTTLVMLNALDEGHDFMKFWPDDGFFEFGPIKVECMPDDDTINVSFKSSSTLKPLYRTPCPEIVARNFKVTDSRNSNRSLELRFFQYVGWTETRVPNSYRPIVNLLTQLERWKNQSESGPTTIVCSDGVGRSGTLAAIMYTLERVKADQVFDAFQAIKSMRMKRPHSVKKMNQYKYIHFAVQEYLSAFEEHTKL